MLRMKLAGVPKALHKTEVLKKVLRRVGRRMFGEIGQDMVRSTKTLLSQQKSPSGVPFAPLSERAIASKGHRRILFKTGAMNRGIQIVSLDYDSVSVGLTGTEAKKGATHQFGRERINGVTFHIPAHRRKSYTRKTTAGRRVRVKASQVRAHTREGSLPPIPGRPFLGFSKTQMERRIPQIVRQHLREEARRIASGA